MRGRLALLLGISLLLAGAVALLKTGPAGSALWSASGEGAWLLPLIAAAALVDSVNPCAFSVLLLTIAFLFSLGRLRSGVLEIGAAYILGIFLVYTLIGLGILQTLHWFDTPHFMAKLGAAALAALGAINVTGALVPAFPVRLRIPRAAHHRIAELMERASLPSAFVLGGLVGVCEFPCTGGPYLTAIGLLHDRATYGTGVGYLLLYNAIFVAPLAVLLGLASDPALLGKLEQWQARNGRAMRLWGGNAMIALAAIVFFL